MNQNLRVNKTSFHMKGFARGLALKQRRNATRKSPIILIGIPLLFQLLLTNTNLKQRFRFLELILNALIILTHQHVSTARLPRFYAKPKRKCNVSNIGRSKCYRIHRKVSPRFCHKSLWTACSLLRKPAGLK